MVNTFWNMHWPFIILFLKNAYSVQRLYVDYKKDAMGILLLHFSKFSKYKWKW